MRLVRRCTSTGRARNVYRSALKDVRVPLFPCDTPTVRLRVLLWVLMKGTCPSDPAVGGETVVIGATRVWPGKRDLFFPGHTSLLARMAVGIHGIFDIRDNLLECYSGTI